MLVVKLAFPSPLGISLYSIIMSTKNTPNQEVKFPSPLGISLYSIQCGNVRQRKSRMVSVPSGDFSLFNKRYSTLETS